MMARSFDRERFRGGFFVNVGMKERACGLEQTHDRFVTRYGSRVCRDLLRFGDGNEFEPVGAGFGLQARQFPLDAFLLEFEWLTPATKQKSRPVILHGSASWFGYYF
jgi:hypothetical protein